MMKLLVLCLLSLLNDLGIASVKETEALEVLRSKSNRFSYILMEPTSTQFESQKKSGSYQKKWPLVLYLHGGGESGFPLSKMYRHGPPYLLRKGKLPSNRDFFLLAPQCSGGCRGWNIEKVHKWLLKTLAKYPVDLNKLSLTGQSMGGIGTFNYLHQFPNFFQKSLAICPRGMQKWAKNIAKNDVWVFHGEKDYIIPAIHSRNMKKWVDQLGGKTFLYNEWKGKGHMIHNQVYARKDVWEWLVKSK